MTLLLTAALTLTPTATSVPDIGELTPANVAAWTAAWQRFPRWIPAPPASPAEHDASLDPVGRWRPLVEDYFDPANVDRALEVLKCESQGDPAARNPRSSAAGLFQFLRSTWDWQADLLGLPTYDAGGPLDPENNIRAAAHLSKGGTDWTHWVCKP